MGPTELQALTAVLWCVYVFFLVCHNRELDAPVDWGVVKRLGNKAVVVYNPADIWFKEYDSLRQVLPGVEVSESAHERRSCDSSGSSLYWNGNCEASCFPKDRTKNKAAGQEYTFGSCIASRMYCASHAALLMVSHSALRLLLHHLLLPQAYADEGLGHAFCLSTDESQTVARLVHQSVMMQGAAAAAPYTPAVRTASKPGLQKAPAFNSA